MWRDASRHGSIERRALWDRRDSVRGKGWGKLEAEWKTRLSQDCGDTSDPPQMPLGTQWRVQVETDGLKAVRQETADVRRANHQEEQQAREEEADDRSSKPTEERK